MDILRVGTAMDSSTMLSPRVPIECPGCQPLIGKGAPQTVTSHQGGQLWETAAGLELGTLI